MVYEKTISFKVTLKQYDALNDYSTSLGIDSSEMFRRWLETLDETGIKENLEFHRYRCKVLENILLEKEREKEKKNETELKHKLIQTDMNNLINPILIEMKNRHKNYNEYNEDEKNKSIKDFIEITNQSLKTIEQKDRELFVRELLKSINKLLFGLEESYLKDIKKCLVY